MCEQVGCMEKSCVLGEGLARFRGVLAQGNEYLGEYVELQGWKISDIEWSVLT